MIKILKSHNKLLQLLIIIFWTFYWLLNVIDKFIAEPIFLWRGKNRLMQLENYFASIGINDPAVAVIFLIVTTILESLALIFVADALVQFVRGKEKVARDLFFLSTATGILLFTFFAIGDQIFGDRVELLEHTTYVGIILVSWLVYNHKFKE